MKYKPNFIDSDLFEKIASSDSTITKLCLGKMGTDLFGKSPKIACVDLTYDPFLFTKYESMNRKLGKESVYIDKAMSAHFFYDRHDVKMYISNKDNLQGFKHSTLIPFDFLCHGLPSKTNLNDLLRQYSGFEELAVALKTNQSVTSIDLVSSESKYMMVDERDSIAILGGIREHPKLERLILGSTNLGEEGFHMLCEMLRANTPPLKYLSISSADVVGNTNQLLQLLDAIKINDTLEVINIQHSNQPDHLRMVSSEQNSFGGSYAKMTVGIHSNPEEIVSEIHRIITEKFEKRKNCNAIKKYYKFKY